MIKVVDLFAGPGGLGEGFASFQGAGSAAFDLRLSIEKDQFAHRTLLLRSLTRKLRQRGQPIDLSMLGHQFGSDKLFVAFPDIANEAITEAIHLELSPDTAEQVRARVDAVVTSDDPWVLIGGPPCQAYSLIGRARNRGIEGYVAEADKRQTLYVEYLQILADHAPPVFVMENVKGLLSAKLNDGSVFARILTDLENPGSAVKREGRLHPRQHPRYRIFPLTNPLLKDQPRDYVVRSEEYGIPQSRHRVILVGVREDATNNTPTPLEHRPRKSVADAIADLPRIRSGMSEGDDTWESWNAALREIPRKEWFASIDDRLKEDIQHSLARLDKKITRGAELLRPLQGTGECKSATVFNHASRAHITADLERYFFSATFGRTEGRSPALSEFPTDLLPLHRNATDPDSNTPFADRFRVQLANRPASTVTSHIGKDGHYYIHYDPTQCRSLTVREAARLQTFPDEYIFCGPRTSQYQQVGNAVPPELAKQIAGIVSGLLC